MRPGRNRGPPGESGWRSSRRSGGTTRTPGTWRERFLVGYPIEGRWHRPPFDVVAAYVDQKPENDLSRKRSEEFGFPIYPTIAEALRCGGNKLAVDAVLIIGEHGNYPKSEYGQTKYPRYEFFKQVTDVFRQDGRAVPVFNDKHLSWKWEWAKEMVDISRELKFPLLAGSSLPVTWRMPSIDLPYGAEVEEMLCVAMGAWTATTSTRWRRSSAWPSDARRRDRRRGRPGAARRGGLEGDGGRRLGRRRLGPSPVRGVPLPQPDPGAARDLQRPLPDTRPDPRVGQGPRRLPHRVRRRRQGDHAVDERPGRRLHLRRAAQGGGGAALDALLPAAQPERRRTRPR